MYKDNIFYKNSYRMGNNIASKEDYIRHCLLYEYDKGILSVIVCRIHCQVNAADTMDNCTCCHSFKKLCQGDKSFKIHPHSECPLMYFDESLDTVITNFTHPKFKKFAETFSKYRATFQRQVHARDFIFKLYKWTHSSLK